jgi:hemerythrin
MTIVMRDYPPMAQDFMNREHEDFANLLNAAEQALLMGEAALPHLTLLYDHCVKHFAHEEEEMQRYHFPPYPVHKAEHERVLGMFREQLTNFEATGDISPVLEFLLETVPDWFGQHLRTMDRVTSQFLFQQKGDAA